MGTPLSAEGAELSFPEGLSVLGVRARETRLGKPDAARIFCLAAGAVKSAAVLAALRAGMVSDLVIDEGLATDLVAKLA